MNASIAYDLWEEASVPGLPELLKLIQRAAKNDVQQTLFIGSDKVSEDQIKALRRRGFHVIKRDLTGEQYKPKVEIKWSHGGQTSF